APLFLLLSLRMFNKKSACKKVLTTAVFVILAANVSFAQDLNRLQSRAQKFLSLRSSVNMDKRAAGQYVEDAKRQEFEESKPFPMQDVQIIGLEFTNDPKLVYVVFKAKVMLP